jgi:heat shock protein HslJ
MKKVFLSLAMMLSLLGCEETSTLNLKGKEFRLKDSNYTLLFDKEENKFYGKAVNNYFGVYVLDKNNIKLELQGSTMMMAPLDDMEKENKYFEDLKKISTYKLEQNTLSLKGNGVELVFE